MTRARCKAPLVGCRYLGAQHARDMREKYRSGGWFSDTRPYAQERRVVCAQRRLFPPSFPPPIKSGPE